MATKKATKKVSCASSGGVRGPTLYDKFADARQAVKEQTQTVSSLRQKLEQEQVVLSKKKEELKALADELKFEAVASI